MAFDIDVIESVLPPDGAFAPLAVDGSDCIDGEHGDETKGGGESAPRENQRGGAFILGEGGNFRWVRWLCMHDVFEEWLHAVGSVVLGACLWQRLFLLIRLLISGFLVYGGVIIACDVADSSI